MPTTPLLPSTRIHSCSLVYFRSAGYMAAPLRCLGAFVKRKIDDDGAGAPAADVNVELGAWGGHFRRDVGHPDCFFQKWRLRTARDVTNRFVPTDDRMAVPRDGAVDHGKADDLTAHTRFLLRPQRVQADESVLLPADNPIEIRLEDCRLIVDVVAVQPHRGFKA